MNCIEDRAELRHTLAKGGRSDIRVEESDWREKMNMMVNRWLYTVLPVRRARFIVICLREFEKQKKFKIGKRW